MRRLFVLVGMVFTLAIVVVMVAYLHIENTTKNERYEFSDYSKIARADAVIVLGAGVHEDGSMTPFLSDRVQMGVDLYKLGLGDKLIMSGDGQGINGYDEVAAMVKRAGEMGIEDVVGDGEGINTYESLRRAKEVYECESVVVVTQSFHLPRAVYIGKELGMTVSGMAASIKDYSGAEIFLVRELLADVKAWAQFTFPMLNIAGS